MYIYIYILASPRHFSYTDLCNPFLCNLLVIMKANQAWVRSLLRQKPFHNWVSEKTFHKLKSFFSSRSDGSIATAMKYANKTFQPLECFI